MTGLHRTTTPQSASMRPSGLNAKLFGSLGEKPPRVAIWVRLLRFQRIT